MPGHTDWHRTDFTVFTEAGAAFFDGRDPYRVANPRGWHYLYPPLFALLVAPLTFFDTESQVRFWYAVNVAFTFGCFGEARRLWRVFAGPEPRGFPWLGFCAFLAVVLPFLDCMQAGQLGISILYLLMVGGRLVLQGKSWGTWFLGGLTLSLPASVKLVPALPVVFLLGQQWMAVVFRQRGGRSWGRAIGSSAGVSAGAMLCLLVIPGSILGWQKNLHYLDVWQKQVVMNERIGPTSNFNVHSFRNQSLANGFFLMSEAIRPASSAASFETCDRCPANGGRADRASDRSSRDRRRSDGVAGGGRDCRTAREQPRRLHGVWAGMLRDAAGFTARVGALLHGGAAGALMCADVAFQAWDVAGVAGCRRDSCCPLLVLLPGDAVCGWGWRFGAGDRWVVSDGVWNASLGRAIGARARITAFAI